MLKLMRLLVLAFLITGMLVGVAGVRADSHDRVRQMADQGRILPLESIAGRVRNDVEGRILEAELESEHGGYVYELELLAPDGRIHKLYYNAVTGEPLPDDENENNH